MICAVCNHNHAAGHRCRQCHCAGAVAEHPQGKKPFEERYDPTKEPDYVPLPTDESGVEEEQIEDDEFDSTDLDPMDEDDEENENEIEIDKEILDDFDIERR